MMLWITYIMVADPAHPFLAYLPYFEKIKVGL
jgi:hypothetical protein